MLFRGPHSPEWLRSGVIAVFALTLSSCGGEGGGLTFPPTTGTLHVTATTTGDEQDGDGFTVKLDAEAEQALAPGATLERTELQPGSHTVFLGGVSANCSVGDNPRTISISAGETTAAEFAVTCSATSGGIVVTTSTTGDSPDPDGYDVILDGGDQGVIPASGQLALTGLAPGSHVVGLSGIAGNCQIQGDNLRTVTVTVGASATADYAVACTAPPSGAGTLRIITATTGSDQDVNGYAVSVDGAEARPIGLNTTEEVSNLAPGAHTVQLSDVAANCRLQGSNTRTANVPTGGSVDLTFSISCSQRTGTVQVSVSSSGQPEDPNGYVLKLDGADPGKNVNTNGSARFDNVPVGAHTVALSDLASNCTADAASKPVTVTEGQSSPVSFTVTCSTPPPGTGSIHVTTQTTGPDPDVDGYEVEFDGLPGESIESNGQLGILDVAAGNHTVKLISISANCQVQGDNPKAVTVPAGGTVEAPFTVTCTATTGSIQVGVSTSGADQDKDPDGYTLTIDNTPAVPIEIEGTAPFNNIAAGSHTVTLGGLADNCSISDDPAQRTVQVTAGQTAQVNYSVVCAPQTGSLLVKTTTTGLTPDQDPDGFSFSVDGGAPQAIANSGSVAVEDVPVGNRSVELSGVAANCTVTSTNPATASVSFGQATEVDFTIDCAAITGAAKVTTITVGADADLDPDGYEVSVDDGAPLTIGGNDEHTFFGLTPGLHSITLSGLASNCVISGDSVNPTTASVTVGTTASVFFEVSCVPSGGTIAGP